MGFASTYLEERALFPELIFEAPDKQTGIIVVVPAYDEPGICKLLDSLASAGEPECKVEVIVVINSPYEATEQSIENNKLTISNIESWKINNSNCFFRLFSIVTGEHQIREWGVGLARKTGMDEAVNRFNFIDNPEGVILSVDADCEVEQSYFIRVCNELLRNRERTACSLYFEHPLHGSDYPENIYAYITLYELHLRYYYQGLSFSGFPYVFHTVGSAFAVKALPYVKAGGMNRRQAGEDFYFIQKLVASAGYFNLNSTTVYPSPRVSFRVPFGTGATIRKLNDENKSVLYTYNTLAFNELRDLFEAIEPLFHCRVDELAAYYSSFPSGLKSFISVEEFIEKIEEIRKNTSGVTSFKKRFFGWFNMFKVVKYLNFVHKEFYKKMPVEISALELLEKKGITFQSERPLEILLFYRSLERNK